MRLHQISSLSEYARLCSARATTESVHIFGEGDGDKLERLGHRRVDMDQIYEVIRRRPEPQRHSRLVNDLARVYPEHGDPYDPARRAVQHHLDHAARVTDGPGSGHCTHGDGVAFADDPSSIGLLVVQPHDRHLVIGEDGAPDDTVIDLLQWLP